MEKKNVISKENLATINNLFFAREKLTTEIEGNFNKLDLDNLYLDIWYNEQRVGEISQIKNGKIYGSGLFLMGFNFNDLDWEIRIKIIDELSENYL